MTDQQAVTASHDARQVLDNPVYQEAMGLLKTDVIQTWKNCPVRDSEGQLLLLQLIKLADKFEGILNGYIENGKLAQRKLDLDKIRSESKPKQLLRRVGL